MTPSVVMALAARFVVGATLMVAAWSKLRHPAAFARGVHDYALLKPWAEGPVATSVPWVEVVLGVAVLLGVVQPWAAFGAVVLFALFGLAIASAAVRRLDIDCHCGTWTAQDRVGLGLVVRASGLVLVALLAGQWPETTTLLGVRLALQQTDGLAILISTTAMLALAVWLADALVTVTYDVRRGRRWLPDLRAAEARRAQRATDLASAEGARP